jgi:hypothetical protein
MRQELKELNECKAFSMWHETHFEIVSAIVLEAAKDEPEGIVNEVQETQGIGGLYELATDLTNQFEEMHFNREWEGDFFDTIEAFIQEKLY